MENKNLPKNYTSYHTVKCDSVIMTFSVITPAELNGKNEKASSYDICTSDKRQIRADSIFASYDSLYVYNGSCYAYDMNDVYSIKINYGFRPLKFFGSSLFFTAVGALMALAPDENYDAGLFAVIGFTAGLPFALKNSEDVLTGNYQLLE